MAQKKQSKPVSANPISFDLGKLPPQAVEFEEAALGGMMLEKDAVIEIIDILKPESFYKEEHQKIYSAILDLFGNDKAIDILTVTDKLRQRKELDSIGGPAFLTQLTSRVASAAHIEFHARIIQQKFIQRELIHVSSEIQNRAFDESVDVNDLLDYSEGALFNVAQGNIKKEAAKMSVILKEAISQIEEASKNKNALIGVPAGYTQLDRMTNGWQKSDLIILAARPSMGKTAFVLSMARNMAVEHKKAVAIFSLEMASVQLVNRLISSEAELPSSKIRTGQLSDEEWQKLEYRARRLEDAPMFIDDTPAISIFELRAKCRRLKRQHDIDIVIIDYLQLMTGPPESRGNREQEVSNISRSLKGIAKELNIPIICLSQLNRSVESRPDKRPQLSDLRESGAIEQDADVVAFIHRPEYYGFTEDENQMSLRGIAEIILAKHRNGAVGDVRLRFQHEFTRFVDLEENLIGGFDDTDPAIDEPVVQTFRSKMNENAVAENQNNNLNDDILNNKGFSEEVPF
ncbi:MAG: replicative DNA helicase [Bacteroidales bacterium]|nr:replicative DNA helicase [Bacteroidales bacterium]MBN2819203.1 replicative DNA helicase [Bacteroidales bacterium]